jgi:hypothetical protein
MCLVVPLRLGGCGEIVEKATETDFEIYRCCGLHICTKLELCD